MLCQLGFSSGLALCPNNQFGKVDDLCQLKLEFPMCVFLVLPFYTFLLSIQRPCTYNRNTGVNHYSSLFSWAAIAD